MSNSNPRRCSGASAVIWIVVLLGFAISLSGCAGGMRGWVSKAGGGPVMGGAQVNVPLGK